MTLDLDKSTWTRYTLGEVADTSKDKVDPTSGEVDRFVAGEHMDTDDLKIHRWGDVGDGYLGPAFYRRFYPGQVLYGSRRTYLRKVAVADFEGVTSNTTFVVQTKDTSVLLQEFLPIIMTSEPFHAFAIQESKGSVNPYVNWSDVERYEFDLPPLPEQQRLADLLWAIERHRLPIQLQRDSVVAARTLVLSAHVGRLVNENMVPFEKVWERSPESGWSALPVDQPTGTYVLSLAALGTEGYRTGQLKNAADSTDLRSARLTQGDLLVSRANTIETVGRAGIFTENREDVSFPDTMMRLHLTDDVRPEFALAVLSSSVGRAHMRRTAAGSATSMVKINRQSLGRLTFPRVTVDQQDELLRTLSSYNAATQTVNSELESVSAIRANLSHAVFGGAH